MGKFDTSAADADVCLPTRGDWYGELSMVFSSTSLSSSALFDDTLLLGILATKKQRN
jgi:hypothetical protein